LFLPHPARFGAGLGALAAALLVLCAALALTETAQAKMRLLRAPSLLGLGSVVALVGVGAWVAGGPL
jgi:heme A synthase